MIEKRDASAGRLAAIVSMPLERLPRPIAEFVLFGLKQAWACLFGGILLASILASKAIWQDAWPVARYDALLIIAIAVQLILLKTGLERPDEAKIIAIFHAVGTAMEIFKTHVGSWSYPEDSLFRLGGVPLFSGFMYASVGSYIARTTRIFDMRYTAYPPPAATYLLAALIYVNFFTHHFAPDIRWGLFALTALLFARTRVLFRPYETIRSMPLLLGFCLVAFFIWVAENIGTFSATWVYPGQREWTVVSAGKFGSWFLLMIISFILVTLVHPPRRPARPADG